MVTRTLAFVRSLALGTAAFIVPTAASADLPPNATSCPSFRPTDGVACTPTGNTCAYPGPNRYASVSCVCATDVQPPVWRCAARRSMPVRGPLAPPEIAASIA